jgi:hypothetical protein
MSGIAFPHLFVDIEDVQISVSITETSFSRRHLPTKIASVVPEVILDCKVLEGDLDSIL